MQNFRLKKVSMPYNVHNGAISRDFFFQALQKSMKSKLHEDYIRMCRITTYVLRAKDTPLFFVNNLQQKEFNQSCNPIHFKLLCGVSI